MVNEKCSCGHWKVECDHCRGHGYFNLGLSTQDCGRCDGQGVKCPDSWRGTDCRC
jgi:hypothetical protein